MKMTPGLHILKMQIPFIITIFCLYRGSSSHQTNTPCKATNILPAIKGQVLVNHTVGSFRVTGQDACEVKCFLHGSCVSYNLGPQESSGHVCELSDSDHLRDPQDMKIRIGFLYAAFENGCSSKPCPKKAVCYPNFQGDRYKCVCLPGYEGERCDKAIVKLNTVPVCFGARDRQYGSVTSNTSISVVTFHLVHLSGKVSCHRKKSKLQSNWGCTFSALDLFTCITDAKDQVIVPETPLSASSFSVYSLPGFHANSPHLNLSRLLDPYKLKNGTEIRLWYTEDLFRHGWSDNSFGRACVDVYALGYP